MNQLPQPGAPTAFRRAGRAALAFALAALLPVAAQAQAAIKTLGVFSLLGDSVQSVWPEETKLPNQVQIRGSESMELKGLGLDTIALRACRGLLERQLPAAQVLLFKAPAPLSPTEQRQVAEGAARAELPAWMVKTLEENRLTHLLILTRHRGLIAATTSDQNTIGRGYVEGIGFYIDTAYTMQNEASGALSSGLLAPYTQIRLTLMDAATGDIVNTYDVRDSFAFASRDTQAQAEPWNFMTPEEKVKVLRELVAVGVERGVPEVLKQR